MTTEKLRVERQLTPRPFSRIFLALLYVVSLTVVPRTEQGRQAKKVRTAGFIPAVIYGPGLEPKAVQIGTSDFVRVYRAAGGSSIIDVSMEGGAPVKVMIQEVQLNPLTMKAQHVDLRQIRMDQELTVEVPLVFVGESSAVKELAGTFMAGRDHLTVTCLPAKLPAQLEVDLSGLKTFDDVIMVSTIALPEGVRVAEDGDVVVASVMAPLTEEQLKKMEAEATVGDVTAVKTEAEEKKAAEQAAKAEEAAAAEAAK